MGVEDACGDSAGCSYLFGWCLGSNAGDDSDEGHGEEGREFVEVGARVDLVRRLSVAQRMAKRGREIAEFDCEPG